MSSKISAVLPLRIGRSERKGARLDDILFASVEKFCPDLFEKFFVVCPSNQTGMLSDDLRKWRSLPIEIIDEKTLIPKLKDHPFARGWIKQQLIKLGIANICKTPFFITFDADVFCTKPLDADSLLPGGKAMLQPFHRYRKWWRSSANILETDPRLDAPGMAVTPAILATAVCRELISDLSNETHWIDRLLSKRSKFSLHRLMGSHQNYSWSEYALYYLYLEKNNLINKYHCIVNNSMISSKSIWTDVTKIDDWDAEFVFKRDSAFFCVIQSTAQIHIEARLDKLTPYLGNNLTNKTRPGAGVDSQGGR